MSRAEAAEHYDEGNVVRRETSSRVQLCVQKGPSLLYEGRERAVLEVTEVGSKKRRLLSSIILDGEKKRKTATCRRSSKKDGAQRAETKELWIEVDTVGLTVLNKEVEIENIKKVGTERTKEKKTANSIEVERAVRKDEIVDAIFTGCGAGKSQAGPEGGMSRTAMKKYSFIQDTSLSDLEDEHDFETGFILTENVDLVLAEPPYSTCSARDQPNSTYVVHPKKAMEVTASLVGRVMALWGAWIYILFGFSVLSLTQ